MRTLRLALAAVALFVWSFALVACSKPEPPTIEPEGAVVKAVTATGLEVEITIDAFNPNSVPLHARSVKARVKLDDSLDLGEVTVPTKIEVPAKKHEKIVAPLTLNWNDVQSVALLALTKESVPFTVEGTASVGVDELNFDVPFKTQGSLTREQLIQLGTQNLPPIPKLPF